MFFFSFLIKNFHVLLILVVWISVLRVSFFLFFQFDFVIIGFFLILSSKQLDMGIKILLFLGLFSRVFFSL